MRTMSLSGGEHDMSNPSSPALDPGISSPQHRNKLLRPRSSFMDASHWEGMASKAGVRLPAWKTPMSPRLMEAWLKRLSISYPQYKLQFGFGSFREFIDANPDWPLTAWVGLLLKCRE